MQYAGVGIFLVLAAAVVGLVWLSVGLERLFADNGESVSAPMLVSGIFILPLIIGLLLMVSRGKTQSIAPVAMPLEAGAMSQLSRAVRDLSQRSPLAAVALAALAGFLASRFPAALTLLAQAFQLQDEHGKA